MEQEALRAVPTSLHTHVSMKPSNPVRNVRLRCHRYPRTRAILRVRLEQNISSRITQSSRERLQDFTNARANRMNLWTLAGSNLRRSPMEMTS